MPIAPTSRGAEDPRPALRHATVALSGESADEVFGGYPWFFQPEAISADTFPWMAMIRATGSPSYLSPELLATANPVTYVDRRYQEAVAEIPRLPGEAPADARRRELFYHNITRFLPILLGRKDRMSMACGFEVRVPFCDYRLVDYVWNVPCEIRPKTGQATVSGGYIKSPGQFPGSSQEIDVGQV